MSKQSTLGSCASSASSSAPPTPPAGPERTVRAAWAAARAESVSPPEDCMMSGSGSPRARASLGQAAQVGAQQRREGRVENGGGGSLVLAEGARPARRRGRSGRRAAARRAARRAGARGRDGRRSAAATRRPPAARRGRAARTSARARAGSSAVQRAARGRFARAPRSAARAGTSGGGPDAAQLIQVGPCLAAELDHVGEAVRGDQRRARRAVLEQGVGGDGHAVGEALHLPCLHAGAREHEAHRVEHGDAIAGPGVEGTLAVWTAESSPTSTASVKVPPTSTPRSMSRETTGGSRRRELAILGVGQVLVGGAVAVVGQRHALAGGALAGRGAALRRWRR